MQRRLARKIKAVCVVHYDTVTGVTSNSAAIRAVMDTAGHPALLLVVMILSLGSVDLQTDARGMDVVVAGSQKGLMLSPGLSFNAISERAWAAYEAGGDRRSYWDWRDMAAPNQKGFFPYTPTTTLFYGLREALDMLAKEGLDALTVEILDSFEMSLGMGLNKVADQVFLMGHLRDFNDLMLMGALSGVEIGLIRADVAHQKGDAQAAMECLAAHVG